MVHSGYHPLKDRPLTIMLGWRNSGYHGLKDRSTKGRVDRDGAQWPMVTVKDRPLRIVFVMCCHRGSQPSLEASLTWDVHVSG